MPAEPSWRPRGFCGSLSEDFKEKANSIRFQKRENGHHQIRLVVPGITYQLFVGEVMLPAELRSMCTLRSERGFVYMSKRTDDVDLQGRSEC